MYSWDFESIYNAFLDFLVKWSAREYVTDTGQASHLGLMAGTKKDKKDAQYVRFSSIGKANIVLAADTF